MKSRLLLSAAFLSILLALSCKSSNEKTATPTADRPSVSGRYVNQTFLEEMSDSLGFTPRYFCLQMHFVDSQRVFIDRGFEGDTLRYERAGDAYRLLQASPAGDMAFTVDTVGNLMLDDSTFTGTSRLSRFTRLEDAQDPAKAWTRMVNERMVAGEYEWIEKGTATGKKVSLSPEGGVSGLDGYIGYEICHTGDCLQTTVPYRHILYLIKSDGTRKTLAYTVEKGRTGLTLFAVGEPIPGTKGERKVLDVVYDLRKP